jgi:hypothetical protein
LQCAGLVRRWRSKPAGTRSRTATAAAAVAAAVAAAAAPAVLSEDSLAAAAAAAQPLSSPLVAAMAPAAAAALAAGCSTRSRGCRVRLGHQAGCHPAASTAAVVAAVAAAVRLRRLGSSGWRSCMRGMGCGGGLAGCWCRRLAGRKPSLSGRSGGEHGVDDLVETILMDCVWGLWRQVLHWVCAMFCAQLSEIVESSIGSAEDGASLQTPLSVMVFSCALHGFEIAIVLSVL